jgi:preprotein translocase subunit YajC
VSFVIIMVLLLVVMYVLMIRPQRQRQAQQQATIDAASVGDDILTTGGIYGTVTAADGDDIVVEVAEGLTLHMTRRAIAAVLPPEDEEPEVVEGEAAEVGETDEGAVADEEEPVTGEAGAEAAADRRL